ncbi:hypothetical protein D3C87_1736800 [compost metagenome]
MACAPWACRVMTRLTWSPTAGGWAEYCISWVAWTEVAASTWPVVAPGGPAARTSSGSVCAVSGEADCPTWALTLIAGMRKAPAAAGLSR